MRMASRAAGRCVKSTAEAGFWQMHLDPLLSCLKLTKSHETSIRLVWHFLLSPSERMAWLLFASDLFLAVHSY